MLGWLCALPEAALVYDFAVIGAGMAGASLADALSASASVVLIDAEPHPGYHATGRSAALFAPNYGSPLFRALTRASSPFMHAPPDGFCAQPLLRARGALTIARPEQKPRLEATIADMEANGSTVQRLTPEAACAKIPALRPGYVAAAVYEPDVDDIDVEALLRAFLNRGRARGVQLVLGRRIESAHWRQQGWEFAAAGETLQARVIVNAAGAWADQLAERCGGRALGLQPMRRTAALIDAPDGVAVSGWPALFDVDEDFYLKPDAGRLLVSPGDEEAMAPCDAFADDLMVATAIDRIQQALDIDVRRVSHNWAGLRTFAPDRNPVVGFDAQLRNFFWCAAQGGYGIQTAPAMSRLAAALARSESVPADIAAQGVTAAAVTPLRFS
jgi:D-arginine dehydrogenase